MKTAAKLALTFLIVLFALTNAKAQQKFEFMTINYEAILYSYELSVSIDGKEYSKEDIKLEKNDKKYCNTNPLLLKVKEYQDKGWEVMTFNTTSSGQGYLYVAYLRKKKE